MVLSTNQIPLSAENCSTYSETRRLRVEGGKVDFDSLTHAHMAAGKPGEARKVREKQEHDRHTETHWSMRDIAGN
ncbi:hypothetical protein E2C01_015660 [Portunus trituberculatus]|uniref:Uncharacterized protein n=1 Tax=Portunus trituberculatus TaxID=210409 RepID=A0A5B7DMF8_PORTR|nr:hypothetical protein [Portunus trituberculatus]